MMFTVPMKFLEAAVLTRDASLVSDALLKLGSLDAVTLSNVQGLGFESTKPMPRDAVVDRVRDVRKRIEGFLNLANPPIVKPILADHVGKSEPDVLNIEKNLDGFAKSINSIRERQKDIQEQLLRMEELRRQVEMYGAPYPAAAPVGSSFLSIRSGSIPETSYASLAGAWASFPVVMVPATADAAGRRSLLIVALRRDDSRVLSILGRFGWTEAERSTMDQGLIGDSLKGIQSQETALRLSLDECMEEYDQLFSEKGADLASTWASLRAYELSFRLRSTFARTENVSILSGWIPATECQNVEAGIRAACKGRCYLEWVEARKATEEGMTPPVSMKNPRILAPFQTLVTNFGIPQYGSIDPTPFVAVAYLCMFGLMFGDSGHGLVLILVGIGSLLRSRKAGKSETLSWLILYCGMAAVVSGLLFGSFFGRPLFPPLWFNYHGIVAGEAVTIRGSIRTVYDILGITIRFGILVMATGFLINWINLFLKKQWMQLIFDKAGIAGGWVYAAGTWVAFYFVAHRYKELPPIGILLPVLGVPTLLLGIKSPLSYIINKKTGSGHGDKRKKFSISLLLEFFMDWLVDILEVYSGYLANTLSFMRVAGLGIAHVSLMAAFFQIAGMVSPNGGISVAGVLVLIAGNVLVIALEGLSAGIQSLRLNYYEFFSKYFNSTGRAYSPISFRSRD
jgi:V/A-type H+-transporting ATPase subunit I